MKNQFIWFFGASAVGKASTIQDLRSKKNENLANDLRLLDEIYIDEVSMKIKGGELDEKRKNVLVDELLNLSNKLNTSILIKGQTADLYSNQPGNLRERSPNSDHRIVFVWADPEELLIRCKRRDIDNNTIDTRTHEIKIQVDEVEVLRKSGFQLICIDNNDFNNPTIIEWNRILDWRNHV